jgi:choline kinase
MKVLLLAAGVGRRLGDSVNPVPKALLRFGDKSLLQRHIEILHSFSITDITVTVGHLAETIRDEIAGLGLSGQVRTLANPRYREGSVVSLWTGRDVLTSGETVVLMDADVLYDARLMAQLLTGEPENCFLLDRDIAPGDEPVKLCIRDGRIVDFHKRPQVEHDWHGESVGFFRLTPPVAAELAARADAYVREGRTQFEYEEPMRDMVLAAPPDTFGYAEVTGLPWTEIDFAEDVRRAHTAIFPHLTDIAAPAALAAGATAR